MKKLTTTTKLQTIIQSIPVRVSMTLTVLGFIVAGGSAAFASGPTRPTFTLASPADHITFNSITDNPDQGDERNFVQVKDAANNNAGGWTDTLQVQDGKEYYVRVFMHNNAADNLNLVAKNTRVTATVPNTTSNSIQIDGAISADNANPQRVWDDAVMTSDKKFNIAYVAGSAKFYNNIFPKGTSLSDSIVTSAGALLGYDKIDGNVPGCFKYSGDVIFKVKATVITPNFTVEKKVRLSGTTAWQKEITANPGQQIDYQIGYDNTGTAKQEGVVVKDKLPAGVAYKPGTTTIKNGDHPEGNGLSVTNNEVATETGINIGDYNANTNAFVRFSATLPTNDQLPVCGMNTLTNTATVYTDNGSLSSTANVKVNKTNCTPTATALPTTGPAEVIAGLVGVAAITLGVIYYIKSRRDLDIALHDAQSQDIVSKTSIATEHKHEIKK